MRDLGGVDDPRLFQFDVLRVDVLEQADSVAEEYWVEVNLYLVDKPSFGELLNGVRATCDPHVLLARGHSRLLDSALDAVGDEGGGSSTPSDPGFPRVAREDEHRRTEGRKIRPGSLPTSSAQTL
jgi:hypothetical protein